MHRRVQRHQEVAAAPPSARAWRFWIRGTLLQRSSVSQRNAGSAATPSGASKTAAPAAERVERRREVGREIVRPDRPGRRGPSQGRARKSIGSNGTQRPAQRFELPPSRRATAVCGSKWLSGPQVLRDREVRGRGLGALAAALEHQHPEAAVGERQRGDDADRARADDADVRREIPERREAGRAEDHAAIRSAPARRPGSRSARGRGCARGRPARRRCACP